MYSFHWPYYFSFFLCLGEQLSDSRPMPKLLLHVTYRNCTWWGFGSTGELTRCLHFKWRGFYPLLEGELFGWESKALKTAAWVLSILRWIPVLGAEGRPRLLNLSGLWEMLRGAAGSLPWAVPGWHRDSGYSQGCWVLTVRPGKRRAIRAKEGGIDPGMKCAGWSQPSLGGGWAGAAAICSFPGTWHGAPGAQTQPASLYLQGKIVLNLRSRLSAGNWWSVVMASPALPFPVLSNSSLELGTGSSPWPSGSRCLGGAKTSAEGRASKCLGPLESRRNFKCNSNSSQIATRLFFLCCGREDSAKRFHATL